MITAYDLAAGLPVSCWDSVGSGRDRGVVFTFGNVAGIIGPAQACADWLHDSFGDRAAGLVDLASIVYRRKEWFPPGLDPFSLRGRRRSQYEIRTWITAGSRLVPLMAIDLAPIVHDGVFASIDQRTPHPAASLLELATVPCDQPVSIGGTTRRLGEVDCSGGIVWEGSRLGSILELLRVGPTAEEQANRVICEVQGAANWLAAIDPLRRRDIQVISRGLFGLCMSWSFQCLSVELGVGLSQGDVVTQS